MPNKSLFDSLIRPKRNGVYYTGMALSLLGLLLFLSVFATGQFLVGLGGMVLSAVGVLMMIAGRQGFAGPGFIYALDPEAMRKELEPWARTSGKLSDDAFSEMRTLRDTIESVGRPSETSGPQVKVRCQHCRSLNDEEARFCGQCGQPL